ncbi:MAG TPA: outer membrane protein transport protein [Gammaproteobacteria bacterium]|nr:outer membrane protein transport protein [Gammaproteobacteria bacterium]
MKVFLAVSRTVIAGAVAALPLSAYATNGMDMEGYGPIATAMGGASMAYDNGTAAMMNNPATLGLMGQGSRLDLAFGFLGPDVKSTAGGRTAKSSATAFYMPAVGWVHRRGDWTYGLGVYGQGGMGTQYGAGSWLPDPSVNVPLENRTELSVGRIILPVAYHVNNRLTVGGSVDVVWAGLDLRMALSPHQFQSLMAGNSMGTAGGSLAQSFGGFMQSGAQLNYAAFDFSNSNRFTGRARSFGYAAKLGLVYRVNRRLTVGATYHSRTRLNDMATGTNGARVVASMNMGTNTYTLPVHGRIKVLNFQWPATYGLGMAYRFNRRWMMAADIKYIRWANAMQNFKMSFTASQSADNNFTQFGPAGDLRGKTLDASLRQHWRNQTVYELGVAYRATDALTLRGGVNVGNNPVPDNLVNPLFPAIVEDHVTAGFGYAVNKNQSLDFSVTRALPTSVTNANPDIFSTPVTIRHSQWNWQFLYSWRF